MPCYRCGARQVDPEQGPSPWRRGVRDGEQVLVCPHCQAGRDWTADLDRCGSCGSTALVKRLGEVACRGCGVAVAGSESVGDGEGRVGGLGDEVSKAIDRLFGR